MVRDRNVYRCQQCGFASPKPGTCPDCKRMTGDLMALVEERAAPEPGGRRIGLSSSRPRALSDITMEHTDRLRTGIGELDRVLGGGDRKSTRLNSSHTVSSYAVFCLKEKKTNAYLSTRTCSHTSR